jgi:hypothetical protein
VPMVAGHARNSVRRSGPQEAGFGIRRSLLSSFSVLTRGFLPFALTIGQIRTARERSPGRASGYRQSGAGLLVWEF